MMMLLLSFIVTAAFAASLENTYLPPLTAEGAGGYNSFLNAPLVSGIKPIVQQANRNVDSIHQEPKANILKFENINDGFGSYSYGYDTDNHISVYETGQLKNVGSENAINTVHGSYTFRGKDGVDYSVEYTADENGFQARGAHLPTPPAIPEAILKSLELNAAAASDNDDGQYRASAHQTQYLPPKKVNAEQQKLGYNY
ncbi:hypothetical protein RI129_000506 [Pyrocoelia pectoralis]|uniref:Uncharacterized protein n=1 Tax=Pyrocoelia pectoralis TaxID=417401 RepID=A0AAN7ZNY2_9COLE